ncbi:MAG: N-acetylmuramoyl-L-alanine amidase [Bacteroidetes bacterium]|nr:MAG: N-acetylmuramoyl-L-alanine amidase [Bacteroidota bacterium]
MNFTHYKIFFSPDGLKKSYHKKGSLPFLCHVLPVIFLIVGFLISPLVSHTQITKTSIVKTIVLDPGHGGKDPGNLGTKRYKTTEKDIALAITLLVGKYLNQAFPEMNVIYTRDDDSYPELIERTKLANDVHADLFISIHCNANESKRPIGADTWVMGPHKNQANLKVAQKENAAILLEEDYKQKYGDFDPNSPETYLALSLRQNVHLNESLMLAKYVQDEFRTRVGRVDRGVKQSGFYVISFTTMPSVLIETGFLTNPTEEDFLNSSNGQDYMASAIYRAIKKYIAEVENIPVAELNKVVLTDTLPEKTIITNNDDEFKEDTIATYVDSVSTDSINYRIQLFVSSEKKSLEPDNFKGLDEITLVKVGNLYKYYYARVPSYSEAKNVRKIAQEKGYGEAFIVSFRGETKIELQEALNLELENNK